MEILALLMIGLIAVLAIVPPIVKGKIDASPLNTTEDFQRSLWLMGSSLELEGEPAQMEPAAHGHQPQRPLRHEAPRQRHAASISRSRTAVKRNRVMAAFAILALGFGVLTLASDSVVPMALFILNCSLFFLYCVLLALIPFLSGARRGQRVTRSPSLRRG